ncbi:MAG TPA: hypothetical protein VFA30_07000 [Gaiellaceae bacterium]|nr:hypothetical protein [Gaiellaceae bacterium]
MAGKAKRFVAVALVVGVVSIPIAATSGAAHAANGECKYGQKSDGSCWDPPAEPTPTPTPRVPGSGGSGQGGT